jgi:predicted DNA-binding transcriptional regulator YafY
MSQLHRLQWFDRRIREGRYPNCSGLAKEFEISKRQAARDVEYLRYSLGAPLSFSPANHGYTYSDDSFALPAIHISKEEKVMIQEMTQAYRVVRDQRASLLAQLFEKIGTSLGVETEVRNRPDPEWVKYSYLEEYIKGKRKTRIAYTDASGVVTERIIYPLYLFMKYENRYLLAFSEEVGELRFFRLSRISGIEALDETFISQRFSYEKYIAVTFNDKRMPYEACITFEEYDAEIPSYFFRMRKIAEKTFLIPFFGSADFLSAVFACGKPFKIESPKWLQRKLLQRITGISPLKKGEIAGSLAKLERTDKHSGEESDMGCVKLEGIAFGYSWLSFAGASYGVLKAMGYWDEPIHMFLGKTGLAFHYIIHEHLNPSSPTVYDWPEKHFEALDRIGIGTTQFNVYSKKTTNTFSLVQKRALEAIKMSLQNGKGVVVWAPTKILEFGIVYGYDDEENVLLVHDCLNHEADPMLYTNIGISDVPFLYYQIIEGKTEVPEEKIVRDAIRYGISEWKKQTSLSRYYATGKNAYANLLNALTKEEYDSFGLAYILSVYTDTKTALSRFFGDLSLQYPKWRWVKRTYSYFEILSELYEKAKTIHPFTGSKMEAPLLTKGQMSEIITLMKEACQIEEKAMESLENAKV